MPSILFICTANICRSPMAAALFRKILQEKGISEGWRIESAGTWPLAGQPAVEKTQKVVRKHGMDISDHRSKGVNRHLMEAFDLILTMEKGQKEALMVEFPEYAKKNFLISEMVGIFEDIEDPIGLSEEDFKDTANQIESYLNKGFEKIIALTKIRSDN